MGAPLVVAGELLGSLVLASGRRGFGRYDCDLMSAVVSQTDSAIVHARDQRYLYQRNRELETLYRVDQIRDQGYEFGAMLSAVLSELCSAIEAEMGFIMLFDNDANQLELKASTADDILSSAGHYDVIESAANKALRSGKLYAADNLSDWLHSIICVPLILRKQIIGVFGAVNRLGPGGFTREDKRLLLAITSQVDTAIFESLDKQRIRNTFQRYVGPNVMEQMLDTPEKDWLKGERSNLTVLFSDMRGFTRMSELVDVDVLVEMINEHLGAMTQVVLSYDGTLDKFVADEVMAIFGAPVSKQDHAIRAIRTALDMQAAQKELIRQWRARGQNLPPIGVGINTGEMIVGNIGCDQQMDYTVLGAVVNLASRLCDAALGNQILITQERYWHVADDVVAEKLPAIRVKGKEEPVQIYQVTHLK
jgi:class 3 adenylate cyclase